MKKNNVIIFHSLASKVKIASFSYFSPSVFIVAQGNFLSFLQETFVNSGYCMEVFFYLRPLNSPFLLPSVNLIYMYREL